MRSANHSAAPKGNLSIRLLALAMIAIPQIPQFAYQCFTPVAQRRSQSIRDEQQLIDYCCNAPFKEAG